MSLYWNTESWFQLGGDLWLHRGKRDLSQTVNITTNGTTSQKAESCCKSANVLWFNKHQLCWKQAVTVNGFFATVCRWQEVVSTASHDVSWTPPPWTQQVHCEASWFLLAEPLTACLRVGGLEGGFSGLTGGGPAGIFKVGLPCVC